MRQNSHTLHKAGNNILNNDSSFHSLKDFDNININNNSKNRNNLNFSQQTFEKLSLLEKMAQPLLKSGNDLSSSRNQQPVFDNYINNSNGNNNNYRKNKANQDFDFQPKNNNNLDFGFQPDYLQNSGLKDELRAQNQMMQQLIGQIKNNQINDPKSNMQEEIFKQMQQQEKENQLRNQLDSLKSEIQRLQNQVQNPQNQMPQNGMNNLYSPDNIQRLIKDAIRDKQMEDQMRQLQQMQLQMQQQQQYPQQPQQQQPQQPFFMPQPMYQPYPYQDQQKPKTPLKNEPSVTNISKKSVPKEASFISKYSNNKSDNINSQMLPSISSYKPSIRNDSPPKELPSFDNPHISAQIDKTQISKPMTSKPMTPKPMTPQELNNKSKSLIKPVNSQKKPFRKRIGVQALMWLISLQKLYEQQMLNKRYYILPKFQNDQRDNSINCIKWLVKCLQSSCKSIQNQKNKILDISDQKGITSPDYQQRKQVIQSICEGIIQSIIYNINSMPEKLKNYLANYFTENKFLPDEQIFGFAIIRLKYHKKLGHLQDVRYNHRFMLNALFILVTIMIGNILARPYEFFSFFKNTQENRDIQKTVCSIIYFRIMSYLQIICPIQDKQREVVTKHQTNMIQYQLPIKFMPNEQVQSIRDTRVDVVCNLYQIQDLKTFLQQEIQWFDQFGNQIEQLLKKIDDRVIDIAQFNQQINKNTAKARAVQLFNQLSQNDRKRKV